MTDQTPARRRWFQFRLRTLLVAVLVFSLPLSWFASRMERARRQKEAVEAIERLGGAVFYPWEVPFSTHREPRLLRWLGKDFYDIALVSMCGTKITPEIVVHLKQLPALPALTLQHCDFGDQGLRFLSDLRGLEWLDLSFTSTTDGDLICLEDSPSLRWLSLYRTPVTDTGLSFLESLPNLTHLELRTTAVSSQAAEAFRLAHPDCEVMADEPDQGDSGNEVVLLPHL